jgi:uncharacterized iron-regulated membrane protein
MRHLIRRVFFWTHLGIGLAAGALILLMCVTGVMLGFERQMIAWLDGAPRVEQTAAAALPLDSLLTRRDIARAEVASVVLRADPTYPVIIRFRDRERAAIQVDPTTAAVLVPSGNGRAQAFFSALRRWHRWIGAQGAELRASMKVLNGTANLLFLALVLSGLYLWWPRKWSRARLRATAVPQLRHSGHVRDFNWHNALGFWAAVPLALIIITGAFISFRWPGQYLDLALGNERERAAARAALAEPPAASAAGAAGPRSEAVSSPRETERVATEAPLASFVAGAAQAHSEWSQLTLTLPTGAEPTMRIVVAEGNTYRPDQRYTLTLDRASAVVREANGYADLSPARKIRAWVRFGHTGEVFGIPGQLLATLVTGIGALLVWTGFALAWRRLRGWRRGRARAAAGRAARSVPAVLPLPDPALELPVPLGRELGGLGGKEIAVRDSRSEVVSLG